jgi:hypothetical protein
MAYVLVSYEYDMITTVFSWLLTQSYNKHLLNDFKIVFNVHLIWEKKSSKKLMGKRPQNI